MVVDPANHRQDFHVIGVRKIPPENSATRHLALRISLVYIGEWNGVSPGPIWPRSCQPGFLPERQNSDQGPQMSTARCAVI
jgi:hypothetical protein